MFADLMLLNCLYSGGLSTDLRENWVALGHKECYGFVNATALIAVVNLVYHPINIQGIKCPLQKRNNACLFIEQDRTGENCLPRHTKRNQHCLSKSLAQRLSAMQKITTDYYFPP